MRDFIVRNGALTALTVSLYHSGRTAARLARLGRELARSRSRKAGQFVLRRVAGAFGACKLTIDNWWANNVVAWDALLADRPTFARAFPLLARWWAGLRLLFSSPRVALACVMLLLSAVAVPAAAFAMGPIRHLRAFDQIQTLAISTASAGNRQTLDLEQNKAIRYLQVRLTATIDIATANGVAVRNLGMPQALFAELGVTGGGDGDIVRADPLALTFVSDWMLMASIGAHDRLSSPNVGTYTITSSFRIWFENPQSVRPRETILLQKEPTSRMQFFATLKTVTTGAAASSPASGGILEGAATTVVTLSNITVRVQQINNTGVTELPYFRPRVSAINYPGLTVNTDLPLIIPVESNEYLRGIAVMFHDGTQMQPAAMTVHVPSASLLGDNFTYLGTGIKLNLHDYMVAQEFETGSQPGSLWGARIFYYNFQQEGRLSNIYNPGQDTNLRLLLNVASLPATGLQVTVVKFSLMRDKFVTVDENGRERRVVTRDLPPELAEPVAA